MKLTSTLVLASMLCIPADAGTKIDDPVKFVEGVYQSMAAHSQTMPPEDIYTPRLSALFELDSKEAGGEVGRGNDFSFWCNCQDGELKNPVVTGRDVFNGKGRKVVDAKFELDGNKREAFFYFEQGKDGWKLDDVRFAGKDGWTYSLILKYGWDDTK